MNTATATTSKAIRKWLLKNDSQLQTRQMSNKNSGLSEDQFLDLITDVNIATTMHNRLAIFYKFRNNGMMYDLSFVELNFDELLDEIFNLI